MSGWIPDGARQSLKWLGVVIGVLVIFVGGAWVVTKFLGLDAVVKATLGDSYICLKMGGIMAIIFVVPMSLSSLPDLLSGWLDLALKEMKVVRGHRPAPIARPESWGGIKGLAYVAGFTYVLMCVCMVAERFGTTCPDNCAAVPLANQIPSPALVPPAGPSTFDK